MGVLKNLREYFSTSAFSGRQWVTLIVFCFSYFFSACVNSLHAPFYPAEAEKKGASATEYGLVFGVFQLVMFLFSPIFGKYMNKLGAKFVFNVGILVTGGSCILFGFLDRVNNHTAFITMSFIIRIFEAIGSAASCTSAFTIIAGEFPESIATTFASLETFYGLGLIVGPAIGGSLYQVGGFMLPFLVTGLCLALVAIIIPLIMPKESSESSSKENTEGFSLFTLLKIPAASLAGLSVWMSSNSIGFLNATLEPHLRQFQLSPSTVGLFFMILGAAYAFSAPLWGKLIDKKCHPKYVILIGCLLILTSHLMIGPAIFLPFETILSVTSLGLVFHGTGVGAIQVAAFILALRESIANGFPDNLVTYSVVSGLWASSLALGLFVGPSVSGILFDFTNFRISSLYPLGCAIIVLGMIIAYIIYDKKKGKSESSSLLDKEAMSDPKVRRASHEHFAPTIVNYGAVK